MKSTWIPSVRRREREITVASGGGVGGNGGCKRPRAVVGSSQNATSHSSNSNATTPKSLATSSFHQGAFTLLLFFVGGVCEKLPFLAVFAR